MHFSQTPQLRECEDCARQENIIKMVGTMKDLELLRNGEPVEIEEMEWAPGSEGVEALIPNIREHGAYKVEMGDIKSNVVEWPRSAAEKAAARKMERAEGGKGGKEEGRGMSIWWTPQLTGTAGEESIALSIGFSPPLDIPR